MEKPGTLTSAFTVCVRRARRDAWYQTAQTQSAVIRLYCRVNAALIVQVSLTLCIQMISTALLQSLRYKKAYSHLELLSASAIVAYQHVYAPL